MDGWISTELKNVCSRLSSGKGISAKEIKDSGEIPVYGGNGIRGFTDYANFEGDCVIIGRQGAYCGNVRYFSGKAYMTEHAVVVCANKENDTRFLAYLLSTMHLGRLSGQSAQPGLSVKTLGIQPIEVPPFAVQNKIADLLFVFDKKIDENNHLNKNLEQQAEALFKSWFLDYTPWNGLAPATWLSGALGDFTEIKRGGSPRPIQEYLSDTGLRWLKISDVTSLQSPFVLDIKDHIIEQGLNKTVYLHMGSLVLSNSATPGIPKILDVDSCIHDGWLYFPKSQFSKEYLYLFFKYIRRQLVNLSNGSVFNNLKTDILKQYPAVLPDEKTRTDFDDLVVPIFEMMLNTTRESHKLASLRDNILPQLMSGELDVSDIDI
jgi:type I restriction enzyme S subunit